MAHQKARRPVAERTADEPHDFVSLERRNGSEANPSQPANQRQSRHDVLPVHPAAEIFPLMEGEEFEALVADIKKHGLRVPITTIGEGDDKKLLEGRNRERACIAAGIPPLYTPFQGDDPVAFVISANIHRRHLDAKQKRDLIAKLLKATPEKSNRQIAGTVKADHKTVASVRAEKESTGEIPQLQRTVGKDLKTRSKPKRRRTPGDFQRDIKRDIAAKKAGMAKPPPNEPVVREAVAADEELNLLREFARFVIGRACVSTGPGEDHTEWKVLLARVKQVLGVA